MPQLQTNEGSGRRPFKGSLSHLFRSQAISKFVNNSIWMGMSCKAKKKVGALVGDLHFLMEFPNIDQYVSGDKLCGERNLQQSFRIGFESLGNSFSNKLDFGRQILTTIHSNLSEKAIQYFNLHLITYP